MKKLEDIQVFISELGKVSKDFIKWMEKMELDVKIEMLQKSCLHETARILRKVLDGNMKRVNLCCITKDHWMR